MCGSKAFGSWWLRHRARFFFSTYVGALVQSIVGATVDFLLTAKRDRKAALRFLRKAIGQNGTPEKITIDKSGANTAAIESYNKDHKAGIEIRQVKYLNNIVEQDHRAVNGWCDRCWGSNRSDQLR